jgi:hypothetical protein
MCSSRAVTLICLGPPVICATAAPNSVTRPHRPAWDLLPPAIQRQLPAIKPHPHVTRQQQFETLLPWQQTEIVRGRRPLCGWQKTASVLLATGLRRPRAAIGQPQIATKPQSIATTLLPTASTPR